MGLIIFRSSLLAWIVEVAVNSVTITKIASAVEADIVIMSTIGETIVTKTSLIKLMPVRSLWGGATLTRIGSVRSAIFPTILIEFIALNVEIQKVCILGCINVNVKANLKVIDVGNILLSLFW